MILGVLTPIFLGGEKETPGGGVTGFFLSRLWEGTGVGVPSLVISGSGGQKLVGLVCLVLLFGGQRRGHHFVVSGG